MGIFEGFWLDFFFFLFFSLFSFLCFFAESLLAFWTMVDGKIEPHSYFHSYTILVTNALLFFVLLPSPYSFPFLFSPLAWSGRELSRRHYRCRYTIILLRVAFYPS